MKKPALAILKTESQPQGVAFKVLATYPGMNDHWEFDLMFVQVASGDLQMNYRSAHPWRPWFDSAAPVDDSHDIDLICRAAYALCFPIAQSIWRSLPTYRAPDAPESPQETPEAQGAGRVAPDPQAAGESTGASDDG